MPRYFRHPNAQKFFAAFFKKEDLLF